MRTRVKATEILHWNRIVPMLTVLILLLPLTLLKAQTPAQNYDYDYIVALYDRQEDDAALVEIDSFLVRYPDSVYKNYVRFMQAEINYFRRGFSVAAEIYSELVQRDIDLQTRADVYLHYATALYYLGEPNRALDILERLNTEISDAGYHRQATKWQARAYAASGQVNSALHYYAKALGDFPDDAELRYEYFSLLLGSDKDAEAEQLLSETAYPQQNIYLQALLDHYLEKDSLPEFDQLLRRFQVSPDTADQNMLLILAKAAFLRGETGKSRELLSRVTAPGPRVSFLHAMLLNTEGKPAAADSIFALLVQDKDPDIAVKSWLERLKLLFTTSPEEATAQLNEFNLNNPSAPYQSQRYYLSAWFAFVRGDYVLALKDLNKSLLAGQTRYQTDQAEILAVECWYRLGRSSEAAAVCERIISHDHRSPFVNRALYYSALIAFESKDLELAQERFGLLVAEHPDSPFAQEAEFYLGEVEFFHANYNLALEHYQKLIANNGSSPALLLRSAQTRYFIKDYAAARAWLDSIPEPKRDSDYYLLSGSIKFNERRYQDALEDYQAALNTASSELSRTELTSYKALTLYQLKRFDQASALYLTLSSLPESPDIYHYLAAKSAYQAGNFMQALDLYDRFLDLFPDSEYDLAVISEIATINYNLGNFQESIDDRISILQRFKAKVGFDDQELALIRESLAGIELCLYRIDDLEPALRIAEMIDSFSSDYIKFELQNMLLKIYAARDVWSGLLETATELRQAFPDNRRSEVELLMAEALIKLNRPADADTLLSELQTSDPVLITKWGDLDLLSGKRESALARFRQAWKLKGSPELWIRMLSTSKELNWQEFDSLLVLGTAIDPIPPEAAVLIMNYRYFTGEKVASAAIADSLLTQNINPWFHAQAYLQKALILYDIPDFPAAIAALNRLKLVFGDYPELNRQANYLHIMALLRSGAKTEAEILLEQTQNLLSPEQIQTIDLEFRNQP